ncbi:MAG: hypothetical protein KGR26_06870 [Cyanobacteria bacterium REEB65]|nr:hypothetical protein [Cyanobacteria bacterium REEB65]
MLEHRRFLITIEAHGPAFGGDAMGLETARILRELADHLERMTERDVTSQSPIPLFDRDGNLVGACAAGDVY